MNYEIAIDGRFFPFVFLEPSLIKVNFFQYILFAKPPNVNSYFIHLIYGKSFAIVAQKSTNYCCAKTIAAQQQQLAAAESTKLLYAFVCFIGEHKVSVQLCVCFFCRM